MFGIEIFEILVFFRQLGLAVAGAAAFWGCVFLYLGRRSQDARSSALWQGASQKLIVIFFPAILLFGVVWATISISQCVFCADAHEGISLTETTVRIIDITYKQYGLYFASVVLGATGFFVYLINRRFFYRRIGWFYAVFFLIISVFLLYPWMPLESVRHNISASLHGWHSIFTLGSVVLVDFLFISLKQILRPYLVKIFPLITGGIWFGLGMDFVSSGLVFDTEFFAIPRVLFMQTLVGIIIINGAMLSGPIARAVLSYQQRMQSEFLPTKLSLIAGLSGSISLAGWVSITALDGFRSLTLSFWQLAVFYLVFAVLIFISRGLVEKILSTGKGA